MSNLARKTVFGFTQLIVGIGIFLFVSAGTLDYWQAWVFAFLFVGAAAAITAYLWKYDPMLLQRRINAGPGAEKDKRQKLIQLLAGIVFVGTLLLSSIDHRFDWSDVPLPIVFVGDVLVALGFLAVFLVFKANSFAAATIEIAPEQQVIATGPYAIVRHPMYAGALIMLLGTPLALGSWWGLLMLIPMTSVLAWRLLDEERFLAKNLSGYAVYCVKVRYRLVPLVW
jgi:protein-S-isoprenylcysteine O-methyltransferase Ste14